MSKLVSLVVSNIKRIRYARINPDGTVFTIAGPNDAGKSTLLDCIKYLYGGKSTLPEVPLRTGTTQGKITGVESDGTITERTIGKGEGLEVRNAAGVELSEPQQKCNAKVSPLILDPLAFMNLAPEKQLDYLKRASGLDFTKLNSTIETAYNARTEVNRDIKNATARLSSMPPAIAGIEFVDTQKLMDEMAGVHAGNKLLDEFQANAAKEVEIVKTARSNVQSALANALDLESRLTNQIESLQNQLDAVRKRLSEEKEKAISLDASITLATDAYTKQLAIPRKSTTDLEAAIRNADVNNTHYRNNAARAALTAELAGYTTKANSLTETIEEAERAKASAIAKAKLPVEGLSFDDNRVLFNGVPLAQAGTATRLRVSSEIAISQIPQDGLRILLVRDGNLLDTNSRALLEEIGKTHDVQILMELVGDDGDVVLEDGEVKGAAPQ
jgi:DNA repair exonuclease SbcCD ATPase subunit